MERVSARDSRVQYDLAGQVAIVTGSSKGIGLAIAEALTAAGAAVVLNGRDGAAVDAATARLAEKGRDVFGLPADARDFDAVSAMVEETDRRYGRLDVLVNNAGGVFAAPLETLSPNGWRAMVETNLSSAFYCSKAALPLLRRSGGGAIVNISSVAAYHAHPLRAAYGAAKAGLNSLTKTMAHEWAPFGIRVNGIAPGPILTEASRFADPAVAEAVTEDVPLARLGLPQDVADACLFLVCDGAGFVTGVTLPVDGGPLRSLPKSAEPSAR
ncbi:SDR family NAD(P)-dependent oxidoreductase [Blastococcus sp. SYSU DS0616]